MPTMNITWYISDNDIQRIKDFVRENENPFLLHRIIRNIDRKNILLNENIIIKTMLACLLSSQQRSGPNSPVGLFLNKKPFPITLEELTRTNNIESFLKNTLKQNGLNRYINRVSQFFIANFKKILEDDWAIIKILEILRELDSKDEERIIADSLQIIFDGFGPKQSRNFLQSLGLSKYEIPIDSRIINWLKDFGFPVPLSSSLLGDKEYYHFVMDGIQLLCTKAEIYPCILDAAIFSSYDNGEWSAENATF